MTPNTTINDPEIRKFNLNNPTFKLSLEFFTKFTIPKIDSGNISDQNNKEILDSEELVKPLSLSISKKVYGNSNYRTMQK